MLGIPLIVAGTQNGFIGTRLHSKNVISTSLDLGGKVVARLYMIFLAEAQGYEDKQPADWKDI